VGRDGKRANCILLHDGVDRNIHEFLLNQSRTSPSQLYQVADALSAYVEEGREPDSINLAASARVAQRVTQACVAMFETAGLVHIHPDKSIEALVSHDELKQQAKRLSEQLRTLRKQDGERLDAVERYAIAERCRGELLGEYFGIPIEEECGVCDACRRAPARPSSFFDPIRKKRAAKKKRAATKKRGGRKTRGGRGRRTGTEERSGERTGKRRSRGRSRVRAEGADKTPTTAASTANGEAKSTRPSTPPSGPANPNGNQRRRRRRGGQGRRGGSGANAEQGDASRDKASAEGAPKESGRRNSNRGGNKRRENNRNERAARGDGAKTSKPGDAPAKTASRRRRRRGGRGRGPRPANPE
jgi:hypothetical protein